MGSVRIDGYADIAFDVREHPHSGFGVTLGRSLRYSPSASIEEWSHVFPWGGFALRPVADFAERLPAAMLERGGVIVPMWQSDGLRLISRRNKLPFLIRATVDSIDAVTGEAALPRLSAAPQNYFIHGPLDGIASPGGNPRQFVAPSPAPSRRLSERLADAAEAALRISMHPRRLSAEDALTLQLSHFYYGNLTPPNTVTDPESPDWLDRGGNTLFINLVDAGTWYDLTGDWPAHRPLLPVDYSSDRYPWSDRYAEPAILPEILQRLHTQGRLLTDARQGPPRRNPGAPVRLAPGPAFGAQLISDAYQRKGPEDNEHG